jgi:hypothetical protein
MDTLSSLGLIVIAAAWVIQFFYSHRKKHDLNPLFVIFYALGSGILAWNSFNMGYTMQALLNLVTFIVPVAILLKISK